MATDTHFKFLDNAITKLHGHFNVYINAMKALDQLKGAEEQLARCIFRSLLLLELFANEPIVTLGEDTVPAQQLQQRTTLGYQLVRSAIENKAVQGITTDTAGVKNMEARLNRATAILKLDKPDPKNKDIVLRFLGAREVTKSTPKKPQFYMAIPQGEITDINRWEAFCENPDAYDDEIGDSENGLDPDVPVVKNYTNGNAVNAHVIPIKTNVLKNQALQRSLQNLAKSGIITHEQLTKIMNAFYNNLVAITVGETLNYSDLFLLLMYNTNTEFAGPQASRIAMASIVEAAKDIFACLKDTQNNTPDTLYRICKSIGDSTFHPIACAYLGHIDYGEEKITDILALIRRGSHQKNDALTAKLNKRRDHIVYWLAQQKLSTTAAASSSFASLPTVEEEEDEAAEAGARIDKGNTPYPAALALAAAPEERRLADDGERYTKAEFYSYYGSYKEWDAAAASSFSSLPTVEEEEDEAAEAGEEAGEEDAIALALAAAPAADLKEAAVKALAIQSLMAENAEAFEKAEQAIEGPEHQWLRTQRERLREKYSSVRKAAKENNASQDDEFESESTPQHIDHLTELATAMEKVEQLAPPVLQKQYSYVDNEEQYLIDLSIELSQQMTAGPGSANAAPFPKCRDMEIFLTKIYRNIFGTEPKMVGLYVSTTVRDKASPDIKQDVDSFIIRLNLAHKTVIPLMTEIMHHVVTLFQMDGYSDPIHMSIQNLGILVAEQASYKESLSNEDKDKAMKKLIEIITTQEFIIGLLSILMLKRVVSLKDTAVVYHNATGTQKDIGEIIQTMNATTYTHDQDNITMWRLIISNDSIRKTLGEMVDWRMKTDNDKLHFRSLRELVNDTGSNLRYTQSFDMRMHQAITVIHNMALEIIKKYKPTNKRKVDESLPGNRKKPIKEGGNKTKKSKPKNLENLNQKIKNKKQKKHKTRNAKNRKSFFNKTLKKY